MMDSVFWGYMKEMSCLDQGVTTPASFRSKRKSFQEEDAAGSLSQKGRGQPNSLTHEWDFTLACGFLQSTP